MAEQNEKNSLVEYRLNIIEEKIDNLTEIVGRTTETVHDLKKLQNDAQCAEEALKDHEKRIRELELLPTKSKAARFQEIIDALYKALVMGGIIAVLAKMGLSA